MCLCEKKVRQQPMVNHHFPYHTGSTAFFAFPEIPKDPIDHHIMNVSLLKSLFFAGSITILTMFDGPISPQFQTIHQQKSPELSLIQSCIEAIILQIPCVSYVCMCACISIYMCIWHYIWKYWIYIYIYIYIYIINKQNYIYIYTCNEYVIQSQLYVYIYIRMYACTGYAVI